MKNRNVVNLLRIASNIEASNPLLARELERCALSVINPGAQKFEDHVGDVVEILKDLKAELEKADKQLDTDDAKEFANFFEDEAKAQAEDLRQMLKVGAHILRMADDETAGVMDKVKGFFKKKDKPADSDSKANEPSYQMDESEMDEFVEGKRDWSEPSAKIEKETKENKEFFEDAKNVQQLLDKVRDKPSRNMVRTIIQDLGDLIERGTSLMKGKRKVEKVPQADDHVKSNADDAKDLVAQYLPRLEGATGADLMKALKDFFAEAGPLLEAPRAAVGSRRQFLPLLVRTASANPSLRPVLLPVIKRWTGR
jgi:predicted nucleotidyltransferase